MTDMPILDLDAKRESRAAEREGRAMEMPIRFGGRTIAVLPAELPLDVLSPLRNLDGDLTLIMREVMNAAQREQAKRKAGQDSSGLDLDATMLVIDMLATNPALPVSALDTFAGIARNLLGEEGFNTLVAQRPTGQDYAALAGGVFQWYGLSLGESSSSSDSPEDGSETSSTTSSTTSGSTSEASGAVPAIPVSSVSGGS